MKQPYDIYIDELKLELRRLSTPSPDGIGHPRELAVAKFYEAEFAAAEATAYHLVDQLGLPPEDAESVISAFRERKSLDREELKHVWTDIVLQRGYHLHLPS